jgi:hypothetical protein
MMIKIIKTNNLKKVKLVDLVISFVSKDDQTALYPNYFDMNFHCKYLWSGLLELEPNLANTTLKSKAII